MYRQELHPVSTTGVRQGGQPRRRPTLTRPGAECLEALREVGPDVHVSEFAGLENAQGGEVGREGSRAVNRVWREVEDEARRVK
jgi:hypothetical protein